MKNRILVVEDDAAIRDAVMLNSKGSLRLTKQASDRPDHNGLILTALLTAF